VVLAPPRDRQPASPTACPTPTYAQRGPEGQQADEDQQPLVS